MSDQREWKRKNPVRTIWNRFMQRAKKHFTNECIQQFIQDLQDNFSIIQIASNNTIESPDSLSIDNHVLTWKLGTPNNQLSVDDLLLITRDEVIHRPRRLGAKNKPKTISNHVFIV